MSDTVDVGVPASRLRDVAPPLQALTALSTAPPNAPPLTPFGELATSVVKAWRRVGQCEDEFGPDSGAACGEWRDVLDDAILALERALDAAAPIA